MGEGGGRTRLGRWGFGPLRRSGLLGDRGGVGDGGKGARGVAAIGRGGRGGKTGEGGVRLVRAVALGGVGIGGEVKNQRHLRQQRRTSCLWGRAAVHMRLMGRCWQGRGMLEGEKEKK